MLSKQTKESNLIRVVGLGHLRIYPYFIIDGHPVRVAPRVKMLTCRGADDERRVRRQVDHVVKVKSESQTCGDIIDGIVPVVVRSLINEKVAGPYGQDAGRTPEEIMPAFEIHDRLIRASHRLPLFAVPAAKMNE